MEKYAITVFFATGIIIIALFYRLSVENIQQGCGECATYEPVYEFRLLLQGIPVTQSADINYCSNRICTLSKKPFFVDVFAIGLFFLILPLYMLIRHKIAPGILEPIDLNSTEEEYTITSEKKQIEIS
ncbi:MAG: hypothetical protein WCO06_07485 [Candidatus Roizmanbacteria bacterium]